MTERFGLSRIGQIHVSVLDVDRSVEFYRDRLGMRFLFQVPNMAFFDCDGIRLYLGVPESPSFRSRATIYYTVDSMADAVAALEARGVAFADRPHVVHRTEETELWMCFLKDPDDNNVVLMREVPAGVPA
jgi:catechol 2,3-dioxygenase-like lactoylglutathione lyase family enzyme